MRLGYALGIAVMLGLAGSAPSAASSQSQPAPGPATSAFIYAAEDNGTIHVYDIDQQHAEVQVIRLFTCCADVRGVAAAAPTHQLLVMYNRDNQGHVAAVDLVSGQVQWDRVLHVPGVDRGDVTPDGTRLYLPTWEDDPATPYELVVSTETGGEQGRISLPPRSHDTLVSLDGQRVFMETKSQTASMYVADTSSNQVVQTLGGYCCSGVLAPFSINGTGTRVVNDVNGYAGFQLADVGSGGVTEYVPFASGAGGHGIAWTPDEHEVWVNDGALPEVHVFDMSATPPEQTHLVGVSNVSHWLTFGIDGRYAYVAGRKGSGDATDVIDASTYERVASLGPSEDLLEVDFSGGSVTGVGKQFGIGRATNSAT